MLILRPEMSNLAACEAREMPLTVRSIECIQPAHLHACLFYNSEKGPRPSDPTATGACAVTLCEAMVHMHYNKYIILYTIIAYLSSFGTEQEGDSVGWRPVAPFCSKSNT